MAKSRAKHRVYGEDRKPFQARIEIEKGGLARAWLILPCRMCEGTIRTRFFLHQFRTRDVNNLTHWMNAINALYRNLKKGTNPRVCSLCQRREGRVDARPDRSVRALAGRLAKPAQSYEQQLAKGRRPQKPDGSSIKRRDVSRDYDRAWRAVQGLDDEGEDD